MNIRIVADSSSNMHGYDAENFKLVPLKIVSAEKEFVDDETINVKEMVDYLKSYKGKTSTSCPNTNEWLEAFADADVVFAITITSQLSGSYNSCVLAKNIYEEEHPHRRVYVIDSLSAGCELKMVMEHIQDCISKGMDAQSIYASALAYHEHTHTIFSLASVDNLAKNGRVSQVVATAVGMLNLRIVGIANGGVLDPQHKVRGDRKAMKKMLEVMESHGFCGGRVSILHCFNETTAYLLKQHILEAYPNTSIEIVEAGGLMSFYAEVGGIVVGYEG